MKLVILLSAVITGLMIALMIYDAELRIEKAQSSHTPKFQAGQCFVKSGLRESWEPTVDGRIMMHGYLKYLVMYADEANRVSGGTKQGWEEDIRTFDAKYQAAPCHETWKSHTHK